MAFLQLNGFTIPVAHEQASRSPNEFGGMMSRSFDGTMRRHRRAIKEAWSFTTVPMNEDNALALEGMLLGKGHYFPFEVDFYSAQKGLGPNTGYAGTFNTSGKVDSGNCLAVASAATGAVYNLSSGYDDDWSVMGWQYSDIGAGAAWNHFAVVYDGEAASYTEYEAASADAGHINDTWRQLIASNVLTLNGKAYDDNGDQDVRYDDIVVVPFKLPAEVITWHYNGGTGRAFSDLPRLSASGDFVKSTTPITVLASVTGVAHVQGVTGGSFASTMRSISFDLVRV